MRDSNVILGDEPLRSSICQRLRSGIKRAVRQHVPAGQCHKVDASDIVQETLLVAHERIGQFRGENFRQLIAWVTKIAVNHSRDLIRFWSRERRNAFREQSLNASYLPPEAISVDLPEDRLLESERAQRLALILAGLPKTEAEAIRLRHIEGCSIEELATRLQRTPAGAAGLLKRGMKRLRDSMALTEISD